MLRKIYYKIINFRTKKYPLSWGFDKTNDCPKQLNSIIIPIIRKVMPKIIATQIIGVQPMTGPVAQIHTLRLKYGEKKWTFIPASDVNNKTTLTIKYVKHDE